MGSDCPPPLCDWQKDLRRNWINDEAHEKMRKIRIEIEIGEENLCI